MGAGCKAGGKVGGGGIFVSAASPAAVRAGTSVRGVSCIGALSSPMACSGGTASAASATCCCAGSSAGAGIAASTAADGVLQNVSVSLPAPAGQTTIDAAKHNAATRGNILTSLNSGCGAIALSAGLLFGGRLNSAAAAVRLRRRLFGRRNEISV